MKKLLLPIVLLFLGVGGGVGAGIMLMPEPEVPDEAVEVPEGEANAPEAETATVESPAEEEAQETTETPGAVEYLDMSNQFIVPLIDAGVVNGIVVVSISLEVVEGTIATVSRLEPKIRDRFLQVLFNHANNGGFSGNFTEFRYIRSLKEELLRNAIVVAGRDVTDVLILDLVRQ